MGFSKQPPLSSLGAGGSFTPGAPPPTAPLAWREEKPLTSPPVFAHAPPVAPVTFVPPALTPPAAPSLPTHITTSHNVMMFNPGAVIPSVSPTTVAPAVPLHSAPLPATTTGCTPLPQRAYDGPHVPAASSSGSSSTTLRGRERYCSGGAWVGPAPGWPKPPATATIENADVSSVKQAHRIIVNVLRDKYQEAMLDAPAARLKELEGISNKLGGLFVFLNNTGVAANLDDENTITDPVVEALVKLSEAIAARETHVTNSWLLHLSQKHWEEVSYWFPALKRLARFAAEH